MGAFSQPEVPRSGYLKTKYAYSPLGLDPPEIRLITLEPGQRDDPIECKVQIFEFDDDLYGCYDTLSYAWGSRTNKQSINVNGNPNFMIRYNLWLALCHIRDENKALTLWVDAICLDQNNSVEKTEQVGKIGDIYKRCGMCRIWLGDLPEPMKPHAASALELLKIFDKHSLPTDGERAEDGISDEQGTDAGRKHQADRDILSKLFSSQTHSTPEPGEDFTGDFVLDFAEERTWMYVKTEYEPHFEALTALFELEWWKRTWVIQELVLPPKIQLLFAGQSFSYGTLKNVVEGFTRNFTMGCSRDNDHNRSVSLQGPGFNAYMAIEERIESMVFAREQLRTQPTTFTQLRRRFCGSQVSWKRDSFYAFLGIVTNKSFIRPDYTLSLRTAITQAVFSCIKSEHDGADLLFGERLFRAQDPYMRLHVPSWVSDACFCTLPPKWATIERRRLRIYSSFASTSSNQRRKTFIKYLKMSKNGILIASSRHVATIDDIGPVFMIDKEENMFLVWAVIEAWMGMVGVHVGNKKESEKSEIETSEKYKAFWSTMINNPVEKVEKDLSYGRPTTDGELSIYSRLRTLWRLFEATLRAAKFPDDWEALKFREYNDTTQHEMGIDPPNMHEWSWMPEPRIIYHLFNCLWERRLFMTGDKHFGLASRNARKGDEIHVIPGCPAPFILRRLGSNISNPNTQLGEWDTDSLPQYMVVGNGYFHGFMGGDEVEENGSEEEEDEEKRDENEGGEETGAGRKKGIEYNEIALH
ncbi:heterokaryon incompatibility protein-domain-containing protein [Apiosordaria backusii]|uniref:Heterokaryon incompatibility protein-domain-containing protein n=1 Tax=Apiosordaria backusii TaxID=314023 RepID=A0AA40K672_9PEZI|nr:heterokaryon incompatibility protein-domain-containing protein [Apiosordaria backusii]